jgi:hypothetical protein
MIYTIIHITLSKLIYSFRDHLIIGPLFPLHHIIQPYPAHRSFQLRKDELYWIVLR